MLESVRNFLSGKRVIVIAVLLAIPFVFFGSTSFGTTFISFGTVNGETVSQMDVNIATSQVSQRLQSMYGEDFSLDDLDEEISFDLIKNEVINNKTLLSHARKLGLIVSEKKAKQEIINIDGFQGENGFDQTIFESTIRSNGWTPEEYINLVRETISLDSLVSAMGVTAFPIKGDMEATAILLETSRDIDFIKVDKNLLIEQQKASLEEGQEFYNNNPFLFLSKELRDFSYLVLNYEVYKELVEVPDNFIDEAYADYLNNSQGQLQNRISHLMIEKVNYESSTQAYEKIDLIYEKISSDIGASIADVIVMGGNVGIEKASGIEVPFTPGRGDSTQEQTDIESFSVLEPIADGFRNYLGSQSDIPSEEMMLDKSQLLGLTAPEMTVLLGGMRSLGISNNDYGIFTENPDQLTNDYFTTLLDMSVSWKPNGTGNTYEGSNRVSGEKVRTATRVDLAFGSNSQLRALAEVYASDDAKEKFAHDFVAAWDKVMTNDLL